MKQSLVYVTDSPIHGKGLFARKYIGAGELIGVLDGVPTSIDGEHVLWLDEENGLHVKCDLRFINHSDEPNAAYYDTLEVCALTDISPGEEITHNYLGESLNTVFGQHQPSRPAKDSNKPGSHSQSK